MEIIASAGAANSVGWGKWDFGRHGRLKSGRRCLCLGNIVGQHPGNFLKILD